MIFYFFFVGGGGNIICLGVGHLPLKLQQEACVCSESLFPALGLVAAGPLFHLHPGHLQLEGCFKLNDKLSFSFSVEFASSLFNI